MIGGMVFFYLSSFVKCSLMRKHVLHNRVEEFCFIYLFIYLFLAVLGLCCCARVFSSCGEPGLLFTAVCGLLTAVASLVAEHGLWACGLQ